MSMYRSDLPAFALSVRQPWAWAIVAGYKTIENRTKGAIRSGNMRPGPVCIHAATGLKQDEFAWGHWRLHRHGVRCPRPETLIRGAIIGHVHVDAIIAESDSPWFGGPCGLVLSNPVQVDPIPAQGALGFFRWEPGGSLARPKPWMPAFDRPNGDGDTADLFGDQPPSYATPPERPRRKPS